MITLKRLGLVVLTVALLLLIPLIAMQFSASVRWTAFDFGVAAVLLTGTGLLLELMFRRVSSFRYRLVLGFALLAALALVWAELAVGIFGTPWAGQ
ncbi:MAG: hypothetical protein SF053_14975 [Bacteroidia bacterium]|nr:hypothetical protein [Bacteroidia bacterium]